MNELSDVIDEMVGEKCSARSITLYLVKNKGMSLYEANQTVDSIDVDFNQIALDNAIMINSTDHESYKRLVLRLKRLRFTSEQIEYAMENAVINFNDNAIFHAKRYNEAMYTSKFATQEFLETSMRFSSEEADYASDVLEKENLEIVRKHADLYIVKFGMTGDETFAELVKDGYSDDEAEDIIYSSPVYRRALEIANDYQLIGIDGESLLELLISEEGFTKEQAEFTMSELEKNGGMVDS